MNTQTTYEPLDPAEAAAIEAEINGHDVGPAPDAIDGEVVAPAPKKRGRVRKQPIITQIGPKAAPEPQPEPVAAEEPTPDPEPDPTPEPEPEPVPTSPEMADVLSILGPGAAERQAAIIAARDANATRGRTATTPTVGDDGQPLERGAKRRARWEAKARRLAEKGVILRRTPDGTLITPFSGASIYHEGNDQLIEDLSTLRRLTRAARVERTKYGDDSPEGAAATLKRNAHRDAYHARCAAAGVVPGK